MDSETSVFNTNYTTGNSNRTIASAQVLLNPLSETQKKLDVWKAQMTDKQKQLHELAAVMLKKSIKADMEKDNGSYYPEKSHDFKNWLKKNNT